MPLLSTTNTAARGALCLWQLRGHNAANLLGVVAIAQVGTQKLHGPGHIDHQRALGKGHGLIQQQRRSQNGVGRAGQRSCSGWLREYAGEFGFPATGAPLGSAKTFAEAKRDLNGHRQTAPLRQSAREWFATPPAQVPPPRGDDIGIHHGDALAFKESTGGALPPPMPPVSPSTKLMQNTSAECLPLTVR